MFLLLLIYLLKSGITVTVINCFLCRAESIQETHDTSLPLNWNTERCASGQPEPDSFNNFKIIGFNATLVADGILVTWNLQLDNNNNGNSRRILQIIQNSNSLTKSHQVSIVMEDRCKAEQVRSTKSAKCCYYYHPFERCAHYKFILGHHKNRAHVTTDPIVQRSAILELTHDEDNPVKLIWKIACSATDRTSSVLVSFFRGGRKIHFMVDAMCNSTEQSCEAYLGKDQVLPCIPNSVRVNHQEALLNVKTYNVHNLSVMVKNADIRIEWNEPICQLSSNNRYTSSYTLVVFETDTRKVANNISIPSSCIEGTSRRRLILKKNSSNWCPGWREILLKLCTNYSINIVYPESENIESLKSSSSSSFVLQSRELIEIQNLEITDVSSNAFQVKWENPVACLKVKDLVIPVKINKQQPISIRLANAKRVCNDSTCLVEWEYDTDVTPCTTYVVKVGTATVHVRTRPPGIASVNTRTNASSHGFSVEWRVPLDCRDWLIVPVGTGTSSSNTTLLTENCIEESCLMLWQFRDKLDPCTTYSVLLGYFPVNFSTLPDIPDGVATNVTVRSEKQSAGEVDTAVISWDRPVCHITQIVGWQILIRRVRSNKKIVRNISKLVSQFEFGVKPCETYLIAIRTQYEDGSDRYSTREISFEANCAMKFLIPISTIAILLTIAIIIALFFLRARRKSGGTKNQTELNNIRTPTSKNWNRIPSISLNRPSPFNRKSISSNSQLSSSVNAGSDLDTLSQMTTQPLTVRDLCSFEFKRARMEFFLINKLTEVEAKILPRTAAEQPENKIKNRFLNTHPYDFNRVVLSHSEERQNESYINASFIPGFGGVDNEYIAAQGPKENTVGDFWRMIWEQKVQLVAMVTSLHECGKKKCEKYWPDQGDSIVYGNFQLELLDETVDSFYTARKIRLSKSPELSQEIQQFHFTAWPDFETPEQPEQLIRFIEIVRQEARLMKFSSPIVVHCSAGVGRTGTLIALDYLIQQVLITDVVDVPKTVRHLRRYRLSMVQSEAQYTFLYTCIARYVKTRLALPSVQT